jgi:hypothetical protein
MREHRYVGWVQGACRRQGVRRGQEEVAEAARAATAEGDRKKRRLETHLVHGADIFSNEIDAVTGADGGGVMAEQVIGQADARTEACRIAIGKSGIVGGTGKAGNAQAVHATRIDERILILQR